MYFDPCFSCAGLDTCYFQKEDAEAFGRLMLGEMYDAFHEMGLIAPAEFYDILADKVPYSIHALRDYDDVVQGYICMKGEEMEYRLFDPWEYRERLPELVAQYADSYYDHWACRHVYAHVRSQDVLTCKVLESAGASLVSSYHKNSNESLMQKHPDLLEYQDLDEWRVYKLPLLQDVKKIRHLKCEDEELLWQDYEKYVSRFSRMNILTMQYLLEDLEGNDGTTLSVPWGPAGRTISFPGTRITGDNLISKLRRTPAKAIERKEMQDPNIENVLKFLDALCSMNIPRGTSGKMDCPICEGKGTVSYHRVDFNGHIHAGCSSCGFNVME